MLRNIFAIGMCIAIAGCNDAPPDPKDEKDAAPIYEAVLKAEMKNAKKGDGWFVFIDGKDPSPELLKRFQKEFPELQPGSKAGDKGNRVSLGDLKFERNGAQLIGGWSNGIDGHGNRYHLSRKGDAWKIESVKLAVQS